MPRQVLDPCFFDDGSLFSRSIYLAHLLFSFLFSFLLFFLPFVKLKRRRFPVEREKEKEEGKKKEGKKKKK